MDPVQEIKQRLGITEVVGQYLQLKQAGRNLKAPCPFHQEKSASFMVSPDKNIYHCFGCGEGGDVFSFVMKMEGLEFREALEKLARQANITLEEHPADRKAGQRRARLIEAHEWAIKYYQASLLKNQGSLDYVVKKRRFGKDSIRDFQIGYAPETWEGLTKFLLKKGFSAEELKLAGLAGQKSGRNSVYDQFRGRIMLAICDGQGRPIGFTGRVLGDELPKYLNTPQTPLYDKSLVIYGLHLAREAIRRQDEVILVEGNMDVVASHQAGVKNVVAVSGTALTLDQLKVLSRLTKNVKLAFDQDAAGIKATERAIELAQKLGLVLKMIEISDAKDPDELIQKDVKLWQEAIAKAKYIMDYLFDRFEQDYDLSSVVGKRQYSDRLAFNIKRLADPVEQGHYIKLLAKKIDVQEEQVKEKVDNTSLTASYAAAKSANESPLPRAAIPASGQPLKGLPLFERRLIGMLLAFPDIRLYMDDLRDVDFSEPNNLFIFKAIKESPNLLAPEIAASSPDLADYINILTLAAEEDEILATPDERPTEVLNLITRLQDATNKKLLKQYGPRLTELERDGKQAELDELRKKLGALRSLD